MFILPKAVGRLCQYHRIKPPVSVVMTLCSTQGLLRQAAAQMQTWQHQRNRSAFFAVAGCLSLACLDLLRLLKV